jgi:hypothetical protein
MAVMFPGSRQRHSGEIRLFNGANGFHAKPSSPGLYQSQERRNELVHRDPDLDQSGYLYLVVPVVSAVTSHGACIVIINFVVVIRMGLKAV